MIFSPKVKQHEGKVGGIFYFFSLLSVIFLSAISFRFFLQFYITSTLSRNINLFHYLAAIGSGILFATLISGKISVFIHELKHSIISSLAGNKSKGMSYKEQSGEFEYTYTKQTAHLNAFISLAPYTLPVFSALSLPGYFFFYKQHLLFSSCLVVFALGTDLLLNFKDAGIHQTDLTEIRGGYFISMIYVICFNLAVFSLLSLLAIYGPQVLLEFLAWLVDNLYLIMADDHKQLSDFPQ